MLADDALAAAGLEWYEVSNWARPGEECRHNELYWSGGEYVGIGCAAHGHTDGRRWWNVRTPERYIAAVAAGTLGRRGLGEARRRDRAPRRRSRSRCARGAGARRPTAAAATRRRPRRRRACSTVDGDRIVLTRRGRLLASDVTARLLLAGAAAGTRVAIECQRGRWHSVPLSANAGDGVPA